MTCLKHKDFYPSGVEGGGGLICGFEGKWNIYTCVLVPSLSLIIILIMPILFELMLQSRVAGPLFFYTTFGLEGGLRKKLLQFI